MQDEVVVVVAGGTGLPTEIVQALPAHARVLAADGGLSNARELGLEAEAVIGDLDSVPPKDLTEAAAGGATDLELALDAAHSIAPRRVLVLVGGGGRLDHLFSALLLLASERYAGTEIDAFVGGARVHVIRRERALSGAPGELVSLFAAHGRAEGVRTEGLLYPLAGEPLEPGSSRGVSNVFVGDGARVRLERGVLLAVRPAPDPEAEVPR